MNNKSKTHILISGASKGLGAALAIAWSLRLRDELHLSLIATSVDNLENTRQACIRNGSKVNVYALDITNYAANSALIKQIDQTQPINIAVLNSGVSGNSSKGIEPFNQAHHIINTNLTGTLSCASTVAELMLQKGTGKIVFINSISAFRSLPLTPSYCASKAGLKAYTDALRAYLTPHNISVISIHPGFIDTDMSKNFKGPKPFITTAQKMSAVIITAIEKNRAVLIYPRMLGAAHRCLNILPARIADKLLIWLGYG